MGMNTKTDNQPVKAIGDQLDVPPGYKRTEVGVIPEDWRAEQLGKHCKRITKGTTPTSIGRHFTSSGIHFLKAESIAEDGRTISEKLAFIDASTHTLLARSQLAAGDILISIAGVLGRVGRIGPNDLPANTNQALAIVRLDRHSLLQRDFLFWCLRSDRVAQQIRDINVQAAQANISLQNVRDFFLPIPPPHEQRAIAEALSDVDALIGALDKLIAKKRAIKQAAMQQLLTGKTRLPGFSGEWETKQLGDVVTILKGQLITKTSVVHGTIPVIAGGKEPAYFHNKPNRIGKTITISASGANAGYVAFFDEPIFASDCSTISESKHYSIEFVYFQLKLKQETIYSAQTGGAQPHIHAADIKPLEVYWPTIYEQRAIAAVLSDMDAEIAALERRRDKTRQIKQGMMQQLLTGRVRLVDVKETV